MTNSNINENPEIIEYGTKQFEDFVKTAKISPQQAFDIIIPIADSNP